MLQIDGSFGEGGGQILRSSLALALLTGTPFRLANVRAGRPKPGLQPQHLMSVRAATAIGSAKVSGDALGSSVLTFEPGPVKAGMYRFAIGTAGATGLVLHTVYLPLALRGGGPSELTLEGGTHVSTSPCYDFNNVTWRGHLDRLGLRLRLELERYGFYPRGGGLVRAFVQPCDRLHPLRLVDRPAVTKAMVLSTAADLPDHVSKRQARRAKVRLEARNLDVTVRQEEWRNGPGSMLAVWFPECSVPPLFFGLGARGRPAEAVADEAVDAALAWLDAGAPVDPHAADQLVLPLAFADGASEFRTTEVTRHLTTNIEVVRRFTGREISCAGEEGAPGLVRVGNAAL